MDRSLTEFTGEEREDPDDEPEPETVESKADEEPEPETVEPAKPTYDWSPEGTECEACGETVEKRWRDDEGMVCGECKGW
ncbi:DUF7573 domain-containing protein [Natronomonas sp. EA1]|uniref:DUF7573 domain-containing protein n=1 Tax=Natronomonas sp. EA1 TaxID=3421655 RepID=UPI003EBC8E26